MKRKNCLLIASMIVGFLMVIGMFVFGYSLFCLIQGYGLEITEAVYFKESDLIINYSEENPDKIESYTVKIINTSNKEFVDYQIRLTLYIVNGQINHYPHASTETKMISIGAKEEKTIILDAGYLTMIDLINFDGESLELEYLDQKSTASTPDHYNQFYNGKTFTNGVNEVILSICIIAGLELLACLIIEPVLIVKYVKSDRKLIKTMINKK